MPQNFKELADKVRDKIDLDHGAKVGPDAQHLHAAALGVATELGMDPNYFNIGHLMDAMSPQVAAPPGPEFPKMKYHHAKKLERTVDNAAEEAALGPDWVDHHWRAEKDD